MPHGRRPTEEFEFQGKGKMVDVILTKLDGSTLEVVVRDDDGAVRFFLNTITTMRLTEALEKLRPHIFD